MLTKVRNLATEKKEMNKWLVFKKSELSKSLGI